MGLTKWVSQGWVIKFSCCETTDRKLTMDLLSREIRKGTPQFEESLGGKPVTHVTVRKGWGVLGVTNLIEFAEGMAVVWRFKVFIFKSWEGGLGTKGGNIETGSFSLSVSVCVCTYVYVKWVEGDSSLCVCKVVLNIRDNL